MCVYVARRWTAAGELANGKPYRTGVSCNDTIFKSHFFNHIEQMNMIHKYLIRLFMLNPICKFDAIAARHKKSVLGWGTPPERSGCWPMLYSCLLVCPESARC